MGLLLSANGNWNDSRRWFHDHYSNPRVQGLRLHLDSAHPQSGAVSKLSKPRLEQAMNQDERTAIEDIIRDVKGAQAVAESRQETSSYWQIGHIVVRLTALLAKT